MNNQILDSTGKDKILISDLVLRLLNTSSQAAWMPILEAEPRPQKTDLLIKDIKDHITRLKDFIAKNRAREAIATILVMLLFNVEFAVSRIRRDGVLRASRYGYKGSLIGRIGKAALAARHLILMSSDEVAYFESIIALSKLAANAAELQDEVVRVIQTHRPVVLKTTLVGVDNLFGRGWLGDRRADALDGRRYSSEEYAEAFSLILATYASIFPIDNKCWDEVDVSATGTRAAMYQRLLLAAIRITKFREAEIMVDGLPYRAQLKGQTVIVSSIDPIVERSVRLGYIQSHIQAMIRANDLHDSDTAVSVRDLIDRGFKAESFQRFTEIVEEPVRRLRLVFPDIPEMFELFACNHLLRDEMEKILALDVDNFGSLDDLLFEIVENVTTLDLFKVQRFFCFIGNLYQARLDEFENKIERNHMMLTSTIPIISHSSLIYQMRLIFADEAKCHKIVELLTMDPKARHVDIQYRPFIRLGQHYAIAPYVVSVSNLVRNVIIANGCRSAAIGSKDRMITSLTNALRSTDFMVENEFKAKVGGKKLEFDIVAMRDDKLFLIECKNAYHPCSAHEMRNSWDHIVDASKQLDARYAALADASNQKQLFKRLGWEVKNTVEIYTVIVIANRVFHGASLNNHPVRQAHEFINVLRRGCIIMQEESLSFWSGSEFQTSDLIKYLSVKSIADDQLMALDPWQETYTMGSRTLVFSSYLLDLAKANQELRCKYGPPIPGGRKQIQATEKQVSSGDQFGD